MKIAVTTGNGGLEDNVHPVLGRCPTFTIVEVESGDKKIIGATVIANPGSTAGGGAGIAAAQEIVNSGANAVITGNCGPNAIAVLEQAGVKVHLASGNAKAAVESFLNGALSPQNSPNVAGHFGMGRGIGGGGMGRGMGRRGGFGGGRI